MINIYLFYQTLALSASGRYSLSVGFTLKALYHASILLGGTLQRRLLGECGSVFRRAASSSGRVLARHTCAQLRKKRWSGVNPSILSLLCPCLVFLNAS